MRSFPNDCGETSHKHSSRWFFEAIHACVRARVSVWACGCARVSERGREREGANKIIRVNRWLCNVACRALRSPHLVESRQLSEEEPMKFEGVVWGLFQKNDGSLFFSSSSKLSVLTRFFLQPAEFCRFKLDQLSAMMIFARKLNAEKFLSRLEVEVEKKPSQRISRWRRSHQNLFFHSSVEQLKLRFAFAAFNSEIVIALMFLLSWVAVNHCGRCNQINDFQWVVVHLGRTSLGTLLHTSTHTNEHTDTSNTHKWDRSKRMKTGKSEERRKKWTPLKLKDESLWLKWN